MKRLMPVFDTALFVQVRYGYLTPPKPVVWPRSLQPVRECLESAIHMASQIELVDHALLTSRPQRIRAAYFRASLSELCRIEDVASTLGKPFSFYKSSDPTLHIVKLLRNYQVHLAATQLSSGQIKVELSEETMSYNSFIAEDVTAHQLRLLRSSSDYSDHQLDQLVMLFENEQRRFGVVQLLYFVAKRVEEYTLGRLNPRSKGKHSSLSIE